MDVESDFAPLKCCHTQGAGLHQPVHTRSQGAAASAGDRSAAARLRTTPTTDKAAQSPFAKTVHIKKQEIFMRGQPTCCDVKN